MKVKKGISIVEGAGCKTCPVERCETRRYGEFDCLGERAKLGLGDPRTLAEKVANHIRNMNDEELHLFLCDLLAELSSDYIGER